MATSTQLLADALALTPHERARLAERLLASLESTADDPDQVDLAWQAELASRLTEARSGAVIGRAWESFRDELRRQYARTP